MNGKVVDTITKSNITDLYWKSFKLSDKFKYESKLTDTIQIGVKSWVQDDNNEKLTNRYGFKTTEPISLLQQAKMLNMSCLNYLTTID